MGGNDQFYHLGVSLGQRTEMLGDLRFDERYVGWGNEDYDLLNRCSYYIRPEMIVVWAKPLILHQNHFRDFKGISKTFTKNKKLLNSCRKAVVNMDGWGGVKN